MAPRADEEPQSSLPGLSKYPTFRKDPIKYADLWLEGKKADDNAEGLWRVHDGLYDFSPWTHKHPGGSDWLVMTKQFYVRPATGPRYSPYTFNDDGFYRTFKRKARPILASLPPGPSQQSKWCADILLFLSLLIGTIAAAKYDFKLGILAGFLLNLTVLALFEPILQWVPNKTKSFAVRYISWLYSPILYSILFHGHLFLSGACFYNTFIIWLWMVFTGSFFFSLNGFNAAHHHPDVFHDGDKPR
ncbi:hypothetical protein C0J52_16014 [Blattella germanica]|nr:hypothetical protein C0J52_16014 [Blattella germanica]